MFTFPSSDEDRNHPELGLITIKLYEPTARKVCGRRRRGLGNDIHDGSTQPRHGKKGDGLERMTTKEGHRQLTAPRALSTAKPVHTVYEKGTFLGESLWNNPMVDPRARLGRGRGPSRSFGTGREGCQLVFGGQGVRLGGNATREDAFSFDRAWEYEARVLRVLRRNHGAEEIEALKVPAKEEALEACNGDDKKCFRAACNSAKAPCPAQLQDSP